MSQDISKIGVIGAGQMGHGIAQVAAVAGYDVILADINAEALEKAQANIERTTIGDLASLQQLKEQLQDQDDDADAGEPSKEEENE